MPIYEYACPENHKFEKIVSMADSDKPQLCPEHHKNSERIDFSSPSPFLWGKEEIHWSAGLGSNPNGMSGSKKPK